MKDKIETPCPGTNTNNSWEMECDCRPSVESLPKIRASPCTWTRSEWWQKTRSLNHRPQHKNFHRWNPNVWLLPEKSGRQFMEMMQPKQSQTFEQWNDLRQLFKNSKTAQQEHTTGASCCMGSSELWHFGANEHWTNGAIDATKFVNVIANHKTSSVWLSDVILRQPEDGQSTKEY